MTIDDAYDALEHKLKNRFERADPKDIPISDMLIYDHVNPTEAEARKTLAGILCSAYDLDGVLFNGSVLENYEENPYATGWCYADQKKRFPDGCRIYTSLVVHIKDVIPFDQVHPRIPGFGVVTTRNSVYGVVPPLFSNLTGEQTEEQRSAVQLVAGSDDDRVTDDPVPEVRPETDARTEIEGQPDEAPAGTDVT